MTSNPLKTEIHARPSVSPDAALHAGAVPVTTRTRLALCDGLRTTPIRADAFADQALKSRSVDC